MDKCELHPLLEYFSNCIFLLEGRPFADRQWVECFAQLIGTVLSLWDAAALDAAGEDAEVAPTFINLGDASIQMVRALFCVTVTDRKHFY